MKDESTQALFLLLHSVRATRDRVNDELDALKQEIESMLPEEEPQAPRRRTLEEITGLGETA